jgi:dTDP-glucose 4,6-dehydratase
MRLLVTGGAGFIGSNFIRRLLVGGEPEDRYEVINFDKLTYAGNPQNLAGLDGDPRYAFIKGDICDPGDVDRAFHSGARPPEAVVHFAAESHVDRSIEDPACFVRTNTLGTQVLLDAARRCGVARFIQISTDEVYGSLGPDGFFSETTPLAPNSPYAASKASADLLARSYAATFGLHVCITRCSNNYGPRQFPEKLIPLMIANALENKPLPVYGDGMHIRDWIHVEDHCRAIVAVLKHGKSGEVYNFGGNNQATNLDVVRNILRILDKPEELIQYVQDRPGHDRRYAMDTSKAQRDLHWRPAWDFAPGLKHTVQWYLANQDWVNNVRSGAYREYYRRMYVERENWLRGTGGGHE